MACKKAVQESMFALVSLLANAVMVEVRVACVAFFICSHRAALFGECTSQGYGQICRMCRLACSYVVAGDLSPVVLMQVPQCQGCARGHATLNTELDTVFFFVP